jgi:hypothetical protein
MSQDHVVTVEAESVEMGLTPMLSDRTELALLDVQIVTAKKYPRSIEKFKKDALALATTDAETAASMFYSLKRDRKAIEGPSVRLAEIVANTWTNLHVVARQLDVHKGDRVARSQSVCWDMERNVRIGVEVSRRITRADGTIYGDDMVGVTQAAALAVAFRNSVFKVVPMAYVKDVFDECKVVSIGKGLSMDQRRENALKAFKSINVEGPRLLEFLDRKGWEDVSIDDFITLRGVLTAIKDGEVTVKETFSKEERTANLEAVLGGDTKAADQDRPERPSENVTATQGGKRKADTGKEPAVDKPEEKPRAQKRGKKEEEPAEDGIAELFDK